MNIPSTADLLDFATHLAWTGGRRTLAWFRTTVPTEVKADGSPVTLADKDAETVMRALLRERFPDHGVVGEEHGEEPGTLPVRWIIDPIDGTRTFIRGVPFYGTLVGVEVRGEPTVGVIYIPALDELVAAGKGLGCTLNGRRCKVAGAATLDQSLMVATDFQHLVKRLGPDGYARLIAGTAMQRTWADCYGYVLVATGRAEVAMDAQMALWDNAALLPVIEEAGGRFTSWSGERTIRPGDSVATNGLVHDEVLALLGGASPSPRT